MRSKSKMSDNCVKKLYYVKEAQEFAEKYGCKWVSNETLCTVLFDSLCNPIPIDDKKDFDETLKLHVPKALWRCLGHIIFCTNKHNQPRELAHINTIFDFLPRNVLTQSKGGIRLDNGKWKCSEDELSFCGTLYQFTPIDEMYVIIGHNEYDDINLQKSDLQKYIFDCLFRDRYPNLD